MYLNRTQSNTYASFDSSNHLDARFNLQTGCVVERTCPALCSSSPGSPSTGLRRWGGVHRGPRLVQEVSAMAAYLCRKLASTTNGARVRPDGQMVKSTY